ncbi:uncharacterized protein LOC121865749 isoform X2 [Homarus americanus]|uniref:Uncharacterized protein n=2 Tax=Homarus americanus TaxID=6706 RepID=A0A8J5K8T5_HOMAM|nr:uncharacterized protein LOC121865749 isoform X2 [Homarus americanus]XP_042221232.1 uncharacterized protein LOC121865749 isoform X2 [Homarus americanus]KAG7169481.1 hypothetical protein Hamer_G024096 [Homarus americanus]
MVGVWVLMSVLCVAGHAHAQLGETVEANQSDTRAMEETSTENNQLVADSHEKEEKVEDELEEATVVVTMRTPRRWKPVEETYLGCIQENDNFTSSLVFVNLTQASNGSVSASEACYDLCLNKVPFSVYITLGPPLQGSVDSCGCFYEHDLNQDDMVAKSKCDGQTMNVYKVYCGPNNLKCFNRAGGVGRPSLPLLALLLLLLLLLRPC